MLERVDKILQSIKQLTEGNAETVGDLLYVDNGDVASADFNGSEVGAVHLDLQREFLLRKPGFFFSEFLDPLSQIFCYHGK